MKGSKAATRKLTITAVALQDHISQTLRLHSLAAARPGHPDPRQRWASEDPAPPPVTLAQRLGLVDPPVRRLTGEEWVKVKSRSVHEGDSTQPCVICREEFRLQPQVLLSCSHVFHRACLKSFERFSGRKVCPMCRREQYETRAIHDGARLYREKCAVRIQAWWRGHVTRTWYKEVRRSVPPKNKELRRRFFEAKFQEVNDSLVCSCDTDIEAFLSDIDRSLLSSRNLFRQLEAGHQSGLETEDWEKIQEKAMQREVKDCPICMTPLYASCPGSAPRQILLLSCSHLFHHHCLEAFELFCVEAWPTCPLCRSSYEKKVI
ncbi:RING finger protein 32 [Denticeps clupeoides]|uniref:RING finger protein 32 n=1 Tax=Denticeps clupeoides TaxID=299321 RepID=UPI0010A472A9|nr:RING finger protein 32 [Denticeps clupeoides]